MVDERRRGPWLIVLNPVLAAQRAWLSSEPYGINALAENFFSTLKVELVYRTSFRTRHDADLDLFRYIGWYNPHRLQRRLGWRSPDEYEADYYRSLNAAMTAGTK